VERLAATHGGEVPKLTVTRPSLEDTHLGLIAPHLDADPATLAEPAEPVSLTVARA
jgi:ABC-2 type transport system ATP-binding protein